MNRKPLIAAAAAAFGLGFGAAQADVYVYTPAPTETTTTYYYTAPAGTNVSHRGGSVDDKDMAQRIASKIEADGGFDGSSIDVAVFNGDAQLTGTVRDDLQAQRAATIAASFAGHNKVMNDLRVSG
jgi:osmotically-inducible protein OsmY